MCVCVSHETHTIGDVTTRRSVHQEHRSIYTTTPNVRTLGAPNVRTHTHTHTHKIFIFARTTRRAREDLSVRATRRGQKVVGRDARTACDFFLYLLCTHPRVISHTRRCSCAVCVRVRAHARGREGGRDDDAAGPIRSESIRQSDPIRSRARAPIDRAIRVSTLLDALFARDGDDETWVAWIDDDDGRWVMGRRRRECATVCVCVGFVCALRA